MLYSVGEEKDKERARERQRDRERGGRERVGVYNHGHTRGARDSRRTINQSSVLNNNDKSQTGRDAEREREQERVHTLHIKISITHAIVKMSEGSSLSTTNKITQPSIDCTS